ncbi:RsiV family protein [Pseudomonas oligotrophica]|uniref:RsiV family protein n=1 Tax=Pseudomonas oligotrophica TaxID=2912055 RepID=UPI001F3DE558|nr:RsiV family protein [Pseudomonas oligotrophica]MCF7201115.1 RsiV family protein [Pseudomonas oligotrophica]
MKRSPSLAPFLRAGLLLAPLLLAGCQHGWLDPRLEPTRKVTELRPAGCEGEQCPLVNIDLQRFELPALDELVDRRLRQMTLNAPDDRLPATLDAYQAEFLARAEPGWASYLQAKLREQHDGLLVVELSSYLYTGGAHGMPGRGFINFAREQNRAVELQDMLVPGKEGAFWRLAEQAHWRWLGENGLARDAQFLEQWPFRETGHVALLESGVLLKYDVYAIAPYSYGHPELIIGYDQLEGILRERYRP